MNYAYARGPTGMYSGINGSSKQSLQASISLYVALKYETQLTWKGILISDINRPTRASPRSGAS